MRETQAVGGNQAAGVPSASPSAPSAQDEPRRAAFALGNRGPLRFDASRRLDDCILDAYWRTGFYVFEGALDAAEVAELEREFRSLCARAPAAPGAETDAQGRPAVGDAEQRKLFRFARPLTDPYGETAVGNGRYEVRMREPAPPQDAPAHVLLQIGGILQFLDSALRIYGHPDLLAVAEAVNGADFTPFTETMWIKQAGLGAAVSWHQDGTTHWRSPALDAGTHGFNFMANLYPTTPANALWVVPGTHAQGKADLKALLAASGSDRPQGAVPLLCEPGDVAICNRQVVHGSFPNLAGGQRATFVFGFHRRASVAGVVGWAGATRKRAGREGEPIAREPSAGEREGEPLARREPSAGAARKRAAREGEPIAREPSAGVREGEPLAREPSAGEREGEPLARREPYDDEYIRASSRLIPLAIDARRQRFPNERPYIYQPLAGTPVPWNESNREAVLRNYQRRAIGI